MIKTVFNKKSLVLLLLPFLMWGCSNSAIFSKLWSFPERDSLILSAGGKIPLKVVVILPKGNYQRATFDDTPYPIKKLTGKYFDTKKGSHHVQSLLRGVPFRYEFNAVMKKGFSYLFDDVKFIKSDQLTLPEGTQLVFDLGGVRGHLTDFYGNNGNGRSEVEYHVSVYEPSQRTIAYKDILYSFDAKGSNRFHMNSNMNLSSGISVSVDYEVYYTNSIQDAIGDSFVRLGETIKSNAQILAYAEKMNDALRAEAEIMASPSDLVTKVRFDDSKSIIPNNSIDAGEAANLIVTVKNEGSGPGYGVKLNISSDNSSIKFKSVLKLGGISPKESREILIPIKASLNISNGKPSFLIEAKEKRGYDARKIKLLVPAVSLRKPYLLIADYKINDGSSGHASGNGNGIPENGETIELISFIKNKGVGKAINVNLSITSINSSIDIKKKSVVISQIKPGQTVTGKLVFSIPPTFSGEEIKVKLAASDARGASDTLKLFALKAEISRPVLAYTYEIIDRDGNGYLENGEEGEVVIRLANKGQMDARDVALALQADGISLSRSSAKIGRIPADSTYTPQRFSFHIPRTFGQDAANLTISLKQRNFSGFSDKINIPIRLSRPVFEITHRILDTNNNGIIEQGENVQLIVKVKNTGKLDAENVVLGLNVASKGYSIQKGVLLNRVSKREVHIGSIPAGGESLPQRFSIDVQRKADVGEFPIEFTVAQKDFESKNITLAFNIAAEQAEVFTVKARKEQKKFDTTSFTVTANKPRILFPYFKTSLTKDFIELAFTTIDNTGIADVEVKVNNRRIDTIAARSSTKKTGGQIEKERDFNIRVPLKTGKNEISVTAYNIGNNFVTKTVTVYREEAILPLASSDIDNKIRSLPVPQKTKGSIAALVIGIETYKNIPPSQYSTYDAGLMYKLFEKGLRAGNVYQVSNEDATYTTIRSKIKYLSQNSEGKTVYLYYSGHGMPTEDKKPAIVPYDVSSMEDDELITLDWIVKRLRRGKPKRVIILTDSCYSGTDREGKAILASARPVFNVKQKLKLPSNFVMFTASGQKGKSYSDKNLEHGVFTYFVAKALIGDADRNSDRKTDVDEFYRYIRSGVVKKTNKMGYYDQKPDVLSDAGKMVIVGR